jgi:transcription elongation factor GreA
MNHSTNDDVKVLLTKEGLEELKKELHTLIEIKRPEVVQKISVARDMGDLSENAAYVSARDDQAFIEGRISELEEIIKNAVVASSAHSKGVVCVGCKIRVHVDGVEQEFSVVGGPEADPKEQKISHESPLGKALMGKKIGDKVEIEAPMGKLVYTILAVS